MNTLQRLYEQLPKEIRQQSTRIGALTSMMAVYANQLITEYGLENGKQLIQAIEEGCKYHDIGILIYPMLLISDSPDTRYMLSEIFEQHPIYSKKIMDFIGDEDMFDKENMRVIQDICLYHHEKYDGSGYPYGLEKEEIPLLPALCGLAYDIDQRVFGRKSQTERKLQAVEDLIVCKTTDWYSSTVKHCFIQAKDQIFDYYLSLA